MKILVYGAGVIGTLYAARLHESGHEVTLLARGTRLADIRRHGLVLEDFVSGSRSITQVDTVERLGTDDPYDVALIMVRRDQLADVMPELIANRRIPALLFMLNNPNGTASLVKALGQERVLLGFPGAGGAREGHVIRYALIAQQRTTLGEIGGLRTARLRKLAAAFQAAGFPVRMSSDMEGWLKAHAFFVTAIAGAIYLAGGNCRRLSQDASILALMTRGVREGFTAVRALGHSVAPFPLRVLFSWLPQAFAIYYLRRFFASEIAELVGGRHARAAPGEMRAVADDCRTMLENSGVEASALPQLYRAIDARTM